MEKYGFIYIWRDKKHKRLYVGCHWGTEDDGYICSSNNMLKAYKRRPHDFRRKVVQRVRTNRNDLHEAEHRWLQQIKDEELNSKFYNKSKHRFGHWSAREDKDEIQRLIKETKSKKTPEERERLRQVQIEIKANRTAEDVSRAKEKQSKAKRKFLQSERGKAWREEHSKKVSRWVHKLTAAAAEAKSKMTKEELQQTYGKNAGRRYITDGVSNRMVPANTPLPDGWSYGQTRK